VATNFVFPSFYSPSLLFFYFVCLLWVLRPSFTCLGLALKEHKMIASIRCTPVSGMRLRQEIPYYYLSNKHWNPLSGVCKYKWLYVNTMLFGVVWSNTAFLSFPFSLIPHNCVMSQKYTISNIERDLKELEKKRQVGKRDPWGINPTSWLRDPECPSLDEMVHRYMFDMLQKALVMLPDTQ